MHVGGSADTSNYQMQTIKQEFQAYIMAPRSKENINMIKFWQIYIYSITLTQMNN